jgi:hypothetical protein
MKPKLICLLLILVLVGCSTYAVDRYSISADNVTAFRALDVEKISVGEFTSFKPGLKEIMCRGVGPIKTPDGNSFAEYIRESFIDELQIAEIYSTVAPIILTGHLENINFSSADGKWNLALTIKSSNEQSILVEEEYRYTTSFYGETACNQTAQALMPSVQNLIKKIVTNPNFPNLVGSQISLEKKHENATDDEPKKIAYSFNAEEPWTGVWKVEGSRYFIGNWALKQHESQVVSTKRSSHKIESLAVKHQLKGKIITSSKAFPFTLKIASDGLSFKGTSTDYYGRSVFITGKRIE